MEVFQTTSGGIMNISEENDENKRALFVSFNGQVRDPIYGYIDYIKELEGILMDSWFLQRLRYIYQLQAAHFVYPGATHTRFSHSVGVLYASYKYISFLLRSTYASNLPPDVLREANSKNKELTLATRILGLLHDIGHGPFSHAFDKYVYKTRFFLNFKVGNHEVVGYLIYRDHVRDLIKKSVIENNNNLNIDVEYLLNLLDYGMRPPKGMKDFTELVSKGLLGNNEFYDHSVSGFERVIRMIVRDYLYTSDIMDYLKRDSYFTGVPIGQINDDWIIRNSFILSKDGKLTLAIASKALDEVARLFDARKLMYKYVYLHPVNVAFIETIGSLLTCIKSRIADILEKMFTSPDKLPYYITLTDHSMYTALQDLLVKSASEYECEDKEFAKTALESLFYQRKPVWKLVKRFTYDLNEAKVLFGEIGDLVQKAMIERVKDEITRKLHTKGIFENDVSIVIDKIDVFPTSAMELSDRIEVVDVKDGRVIYEESKYYNEFALEYGLKSEALISLYINRKKYKSLEQGDLENIINTTEALILNSIKGKRKEAPETS
ncbi:MAG: HD domain-containing protein [Desulfurococcaceae archaeon]